MNVFKRIGDIISSNVNSALDKMEDPEKMIDLAITKLEDGISELKATIVEKSAEKKKIETIVAERKAMRDRWQDRAVLAAQKNEEEMAKEALSERIRLDSMIRSDEDNLTSITALLESLRTSKDEAEEKLLAMRSKSAELKARARSAKNKIKVNNIVSNNENAKFEKRMAEIRAKIEKWECQADEGYVPPKKEEGAKSFEELEKEATIEAELQKLKESI